MKGITIKLPGSSEDVVSGCGTKVITPGGEELDCVTSVDIHIDGGSIVTATIECFVDGGQSFENIAACLGFETFKEMAEANGYSLGSEGKTILSSSCIKHKKALEAGNGN